MTIQLQTRRFTVAEYDRMAEAGILTEDDRVELIEGEIVQMAPIGSRHAAGVKRLIDIFSAHCRGRAIIGAQDPLRLSEASEPEPDLMLLRPRQDFYASAHPGPQDVLLLVEVADTTLEYDRHVKIPLYARAGVPEVWLEDLTAATIEVYRDPSPQGYRDMQLVGRDRRLSPQAFPDVALATDDLLP